MHYILTYQAVDNYVEKRMPYREAHLKLAREAHEKGDLLMAGAFADPVDGSVLVFKGDSPAVAEAFAKNDPYVLNGIITSWTVRAWTVVIGGE